MVKNLLIVTILYFAVLNLLPDIMQFKLVNLLPNEFRTQARIVVVLSTLVKSSLTVLFFGLLFIVNRYTLRFADAEIPNGLVINAFACLFLAAIVVECIRMGMAYTLLIPFSQKFAIHSVKDYHVLLTEKIPNSRWHEAQQTLDTSFIFMGPIVYSSYLFRYTKERWLDVLLSGFIICAGLMLVWYVSL